MRKKLCVAGCSFSDYTKVDRVYGEILADKLNYDYIHEGAGCGSNWRIWRQITNHILRGNITSNDLLIIQYTQRSRVEFWSRSDNYGQDVPRGVISVREKYPLGGILTRFKPDSHTWQEEKFEKKFHKMYEDNFLNEEYDLERFIAQNLMFQSMLIYYKIPTIFIEGTRINPAGCDILEEHKKYFFEDSKTQIKDRKYDLTPGDWSHLNQEGHHVYADLLYNHIKSLDIL